MENTVSSNNRFGRYFRSDLRAAISNFGISLLVFSTMAATTEIFNGLFSLMLTGQWIGMTQSFRVLLFMIFGIIMLLSSPAKLYGHLTDRKEGTAFLMLPASRFEKFISMVLITCVIVPLFFVVVYFSFDALVCLLDPTAGESLFRMVFLSRFHINFNDFSVINLPVESFKAILSPWLYLDDFTQTSLLFLLGALIFKKSKVGKTLGCLILIALSLELITTPIMSFFMLDKFNMLSDMSNVDFNAEFFSANFPFLSWALNHLVLLDTINDIAMNGLLLFLVWLRLKKMKH